MQNALVLGTFDGLHIGHRAVIDSAKGHNIIAVTFEVPPKSYFLKDCGMLMSFEERCEGLRKLGVGKIHAACFENERDKSPTDFLNELLGLYSPRLICCGYDYRYGRGACGNRDTLKAFCLQNGIEFCCTEPILSGNAAASSTEIRCLISNGNIQRANELLYMPFGFSAFVNGGDRRGRTIGFPTFNQNYPEKLQKPKFGVYASKSIIDGKEYNSITNIGMRPTYKTDRITCETFVLDFSGDLYGKSVRLEPKKFLREEKKFPSLEALKNAIFEDTEKAKVFFGENP